MEHDHNHEHNHDHEHPTTDRLKFALIATGATFVAEVVGGIISGSLALLADSAHVFMDTFALALSFGAAKLSRLPATTRRTYGWHRAEILAAFLNGLMLCAVAVGIIYEAWRRLSAPSHIRTTIMLVFAVVGLVTNVVVAARLHRKHEHDLNVRSAFLHVASDTAASVAVVVAGALISLTGAQIIDPILSMAIAALIVVGGLILLRKTGHILLEGTPVGISVDDVAKSIGALQSVRDVHDVHIWTVCSHILSLSCHVRVDPGSRDRRDEVLAAINALLLARYGISHATIQIDCGACADDVITQDLSHP